MGEFSAACKLCLVCYLPETPTPSIRLTPCVRTTAQACGSMLWRQESDDSESVESLFFLADENPIQII
jgi:hypothetical protein